jgi:phospholipid transport system substrate-binding protein
MMKAVSQYLVWLMVLSLVAVLLLVAAPLEANTAPEALVKATVDEVLSVIKRTSDKNALRRLAEEKVLPRFAFRQMTQLAVGPAWHRASPEQRQALESGFRTLLVNTYTGSLSLAASGDRKVEVRPARQAGRKDTVVRTLVTQSGKPPISIDYRMENSPDGWKVYDVLVEGVSLVTNYRGTFSEEVRRSGIDGLIRVLETKNRALAKG